MRGGRAKEAIEKKTVLRLGRPANGLSFLCGVSTAMFGTSQHNNMLKPAEKRLANEVLPDD
jgi:hypothetical protein